MPKIWQHCHLKRYYSYTRPVPEGTGREAATSRLYVFNQQTRQSPGGKMNTNLYVEGFNLYYGAVKDTPHRWLEIAHLAQALLPKNQILKIKYFAALVSARPSDPGKPTRQQFYLRALRTIPAR